MNQTIKKVVNMRDMAINWSVVRRKLTEIKPYEKNPRVINTESSEFKDLDASISQFGLAEIITINQDNTIIGGHARVIYLGLKGIEEVDCYYPDRMLTDDEVAELCIRLNKNVAGKWDNKSLAEYFTSEQLGGFGFNEKELNKIFPNHEFRESGITYKQQFGIMVTCKDEAEQMQLFEQLQALGLTLKVVVS